MQDSEELVHVWMVTFNHENFIANAIESVLMQKTDFNYRLIIGEDNSTDRTREIVKKYAQKYPDKISVYLNKKNLGPKDNASQIYKACSAKYMALLEGDDYWTDSLKLQKQVDFLENNEEYFITCGGFTYKEGNKLKETIKRGIVAKKHENENGFTFTLQDFTKDWLTKTLTVLFRNDQEVIKKLITYKYGKDVHLFYNLLKKGKGYYFKEILGHYRIHEGGVHSMKSLLNKLETNKVIFEELHNTENDFFTRDQKFKSIVYFFLIKNVNSKQVFREAIPLLKNIGDLSYLFKFYLRHRIMSFIMDRNK